MHIRAVMMVNVLVVGLLLSSGCRMPWSKKAGAGAGAGGSDLGLNDPTMVESTDFSKLTDEFGNIIDDNAGRFEDIYQAVEGANFAPVYFAFDSYALPPTEISKIEQVAQHLLANIDHVLVIEGHCDERGSNEYNLALGDNRASSVRSRLVQLGIPENRIQCRSYGEEKPAVMGSGEEAWRLNRRGEFALFHK